MYDYLAAFCKCAKCHYQQLLVQKVRYFQTCGRNFIKEIIPNQLWEGQQNFKSSVIGLNLLGVNSLGLFEGNAMEIVIG